MELVRVRFRDCACPGTPHHGKDGTDDGDVAQLRPFLSFEGGAAAWAAIADAVTAGKMTGPHLVQYLGPPYLRYGVVGWNLVDGEGQPVAFSPEAALELPFQDAYALVDKADDLYTAAVTAPLGLPTASSLPTGKTNGSSSTSAIPRSSSKRRSQSKSSSSAPASRPA